MNQDDRSPDTRVKLEELLRLKRAERPSQEYWSQFERELRQNLVRTAVREETGTIRLFRGFTRKLRLAVPAAAALALLALVLFGPALRQGVDSLSRPGPANSPGVNTAALSREDFANPATLPALDEELAHSQARFDVHSFTAEAPRGRTYTEVHATQSMDAQSPDGVFFVVGALTGTQSPGSLRNAAY